jgi:cysteinyl-tRNA synthetase
MTRQVYNSLTQSLTDFPTQSCLRWYTCGPTVYDSAHLGHARNYLAQDIIRRILQDYFQYDIQLVMNITDIDDKIIQRSTEMKIPFTQLTTRYEQEFFQDLDDLGVLRPTTLTRVSQYIPEIRTYIQRIIDHGWAYPTNGSVYFNVTAYSAKYPYGRLHPVDVALIEEGEGFFRSVNPDKRGQYDFALWKKSRDNEPAWESPWGPGRPGWHIECSVMATAILGTSFELHSGGEDLKFPHHENELAQAVAYSDNPKWVDHFLHFGHLHIAGRKMSKSLKNFITIREALQTYTPRQIRMLFVLHHYRSTLNYSEDTMAVATERDRFFQEFLDQMTGRLRTAEASRWEQPEQDLNQKLRQAQAEIRQALSQDFDTPQVIKILANLIKAGYIYLQSRADRHLLISMADYVRRILGVFGLSYIPPVVDSRVPQLLDVITEFRDDDRSLARNKDLSRGQLFELTDRYRDTVLPSIGVHLDDTKSGKSVWKL